ncbi:MAG: TatD family hydrolase [Candidatus Puniceispirillaceae bacterium]
MSEPLSIIDSHAHLDYPQFADQLPEIIERAAALGVTEMISIGVRLDTAHRPRLLAEAHDNVWFSVGIHPHEAEKDPQACDYEALVALASHDKCVAIGEAGLDYFYDYAPRQAQADSFRTQIRAARDCGLPIIVHARDADEDMANILEQEMKTGTFTGVLHCFSSGAELARRALDIGFYISFSGILTFNKSEDLREIAKNVPLDRLLVETDSPYLAPPPYRGKTNEPGFTRYVLNRLAEIRGLSEADMAAQTRQNTLTLFNKMERHKPLRAGA